MAKRTGELVARDALALSAFELALASDKSPATEVRPVYRYSVVPGGAYTPAELAEAIERDPVVAAHYAGLNPETLRIERVSAPRWEYMSYRVGDQIYWTKAPIRLNVGETILTDGVTTIRGRCGNCIASEPLGPASVNEPPPAELTEREDEAPEEPTVLAALPPIPQVVGLHSGPALADHPLLVVPPAPPVGVSTNGVALMFSGIGPDNSDGPKDSDDPEDPGSPGNPGDPDKPEDPNGPDDPGGPDSPGGPDTPNDPEEPELPEEPETPGTPEYPGDPEIREFPDDPETPQQVPEPGTLLMVGIGAAGMLMQRLRRRS